MQRFQIIHGTYYHFSELGTLCQHCLMIDPSKRKSRLSGGVIYRNA